MANWVSCTDATAEPNPISYFINLDHVARIARYDDDTGTLLTMAEGSSFTVKERPEELLRLRHPDPPHRQPHVAPAKRSASPLLAG